MSADIIEFARRLAGDRKPSPTEAKTPLTIEQLLDRVIAYVDRVDGHMTEVHRDIAEVSAQIARLRADVRRMRRMSMVILATQIATVALLILL